MNADWSDLPPAEIDFHARDRAITSVLMEFEGPQLVTLTEPDGNYLALAVDEDLVSTRWLQAPVSELELEAILSGVQPLREAFKKPGVIVADYPHGFESPLHIRRVDWDDIPEDVLPVRGLRLSRALAARAPEPMLRVSGRGAALGGALLPQLARVLMTVNDVWAAITEHVFGVATPHPYSAYAIARGSLGVAIHADDMATLTHVMERYENLVRVSQEADALDEALIETPPPVLRAYERHLEALESERAEVMTQWSGGAVFIGPGTAESALESYPTGAASETRTVPIKHRGNFEGFWPVGTRWRFAFRDIETNEGLQGRIGKDVKKTWAKDYARDAALIVGRAGQRYEITVMTTTEIATGAVTKRQLINYRPIRHNQTK